MNLDDTQVLDDSFNGETEDENDLGSDRNLVANLIVKDHLEGIRDSSFCIYNGLNKIGRGLDCQVCIDSEFISKAHCIIEYVNGTHLVMDCQSKNRTKKNKIFLLPNVRYELKNGDTLKLGNVFCNYKFIEKIHRSSDNFDSNLVVADNNFKNCNRLQSNCDGDDTEDDCDDNSSSSRDLLDEDNETALREFVLTNSSLIKKENLDDSKQGNIGDKIESDKSNLCLDSASFDGHKFDLFARIQKEEHANSKNDPPAIPMISKSANKSYSSDMSMENQESHSASKLFVEDSPKDDKSKSLSGSSTPSNFKSGFNVIFETPISNENPLNAMDNSYVPQDRAQKSDECKSPQFAAETQDLDEAPNQLRRRILTIPGNGSLNITEVPDTPEKDHFECETPIAGALNNMSAEDNNSSLVAKVQLKMKLFESDDKKDSVVDIKSSGIVTIDDTINLKEKAKREIGRLDGAATEDQNRVPKMAENSVSVNEEELHVKGTVNSFSTDMEMQNEINLPLCCPQDEVIDHSKNEFDLKIYRGDKSKNDIKGEKYYENEPGEKMLLQSVEHDGYYMVIENQKSTLESDDKHDGMEENQAADFKDVIKYSDKLTVKNQLDIPPPSEMVISDAQIFPKSYAHKSSLTPQFKSLTGLSEDIIIDINLNLDNRQHIASPKEKSSKSIVSKRLLKRSLRKKLFGFVSDEYELNCKSGFYDSFCQRRHSKEELVEEEILNARDLPNAVTESLSNSFFKGKLDEKKVLKRKASKSKSNSLKKNVNATVLKDDTETFNELAHGVNDIQNDRRVSTRNNKGRKRCNPDFIEFLSQNKAVENVCGYGGIGNGETANYRDLTDAKNSNVNLINEKDKDDPENDKLVSNDYKCKNVVSNPNQRSNIQNDSQFFSYIGGDGANASISTQNNATKNRNHQRKGSKSKSQMKRRLHNVAAKDDKDFHHDKSTLVANVEKIEEKDNCKNEEVAGNFEEMSKDSLSMDHKIVQCGNAKKISNECHSHFDVDMCEPVFKKNEVEANENVQKKQRGFIDSLFDNVLEESKVSKSSEGKNKKRKRDNKDDDNNDDDVNQSEERKTLKRNKISRNSGNNFSEKTLSECNDSKINKNEALCVEGNSVEICDNNCEKQKSILQNARKTKLVREDENDLERTLDNVLASKRNAKFDQKFMNEKYCSSFTKGSGEILWKPKIMFTGVRDEDDAIKILTKLGGEKAESIMECTHIISDQVRRTIKFMCGMARGIPIVSVDWLRECKKQKKFVDAQKYLIKDEESEIKFKFNLEESLIRASSRKLFEGFTFIVTKNVKPQQSEMKEIINCAGGKVLDVLPKKFTDDLIAVTCVEDSKMWKNLKAHKVSLVSPEFVMTGILRHSVDLEEFQMPNGANKEKVNPHQSETEFQSGRKKWRGRNI